jgi:HSP20 family protein
MAQEIKKPMTGGAPVSRYRDPFAEMRAEMDRLFDTFLGRGFVGRPAPSASAESAATLASNVDIRENDKEIIVEAELPGIEEKDIQVTVRDGVLSLKGEKKSERDEKKDTYHLVERSYGSFERSFELPDSADQDKIKAEFNKGVLRVVVAKRAEAAKAEKKIPIGKG